MNFISRAALTISQAPEKVDLVKCEEALRIARELAVLRCVNMDYFDLNEAPGDEIYKFRSDSVKYCTDLAMALQELGGFSIDIRRHGMLEVKTDYSIN